MIPTTNQKKKKKNSEQFYVVDASSHFFHKLIQITLSNKWMSETHSKNDEKPKKAERNEIIPSPSNFIYGRLQEIFADKKGNDYVI